MWLLGTVSLVALLRVLAHLQVVDVAGISALSWWWVIGGFALSAAWFAYADFSGLTTRKAMERMGERKQARIQKQRDALGVRRKR
ncbi:TIGR04438 family Trp-rich protein [Comamonas sp. NoAH]|uniref:TIGR04438 family Trp-rich protein n=1 Tax=Comamonas halotolerans TaxID=3041496 RepID=UPI0024E0F831|nr:TIGR04438 family Trp-rich protein [Comamonas sp. NoAH]